MTSAELRRIVGAMEHDIVDDLRKDMEFNAYRKEYIAAIVTLANHADALVALVEACERLAAYELQGMDLGVGARGAVLAMRGALLAVHATKVAP